MGHPEKREGKTSPAAIASMVVMGIMMIAVLALMLREAFALPDEQISVKIIMVCVAVVIVGGMLLFIALIVYDKRQSRKGEQEDRPQAGAASGGNAAWRAHKASKKDGRKKSIASLMSNPAITILRFVQSSFWVQAVLVFLDVVLACWVIETIVLGVAGMAVDAMRTVVVALVSALLLALLSLVQQMADLAPFSFREKDAGSNAMAKARAAKDAAKPSLVSCVGSIVDEKLAMLSPAKTRNSGFGREDCEQVVWVFVVWARRNPLCRISTRLCAFVVGRRLKRETVESLQAILHDEAFEQLEVLSRQASDMALRALEEGRPTLDAEEVREWRKKLDAALQGVRPGNAREAAALYAGALGDLDAMSRLVADKASGAVKTGVAEMDEQTRQRASRRLLIDELEGRALGNGVRDGENAHVGMSV